MARPTTAARRYAEAAFELATRDDALDAWQDGLDLAATLVGNPAVARIVGNPALPFAERTGLVASLLDGRVPAPVRRVADLLTTRGRIELLPAVAREYRRLLNARRGIVAAVVTSAAPLDAGQIGAVRAKIGAMTDASIELTAAVDPELIGGLTVRIGDRLYDASVRGRLERLRHRLLSETR